MKKYLFIIIPTFLFLGAGCSVTTQKQLPNPLTTTVSETTTTTDLPSDYQDCVNFLPFVAATSTKLYSDPKANFTFEYPSNWVLNPSFPAENFKNEIYASSGHDDYPDPCPGLDCNGQLVNTIVKSYMLSDQKHSVAVQMCDRVASISWHSAPPSTSASGLSTISIDGIGVHLRGGDFVTTTQEFIDQIEKIIRSIRIK